MKELSELMLFGHLPRIDLIQIVFYLMEKIKDRFYCECTGSCGFWFLHILNKY